MQTFPSVKIPRGMVRCLITDDQAVKGYTLYLCLRTMTRTGRFKQYRSRQMKGIAHRLNVSITKLERTTVWMVRSDMARFDSDGTLCLTPLRDIHAKWQSARPSSRFHFADTSRKHSRWTYQKTLCWVYNTALFEKFEQQQFASRHDLEGPVVKAPAGRHDIHTPVTKKQLAYERKCAARENGMDNPKKKSADASVRCSITSISVYFGKSRGWSHHLTQQLEAYGFLRVRVPKRERVKLSELKEARLKGKIDQSAGKTFRAKNGMLYRQPSMHLESSLVGFEKTGKVRYDEKDVLRHVRSKKVSEYHPRRDRVSVKRKTTKNTVSSVKSYSDFKKRQELERDMEEYFGPRRSKTPSVPSSGYINFGQISGRNPNRYFDPELQSFLEQEYARSTDPFTKLWYEGIIRSDHRTD